MEIIKPNFVVGSEKKFFDFISKLNEKDKIALISHIDLDGLASAKIVNEAIEADYLDFINYDDLNESLIEKLKDMKIKKLVLTDLTMDDMGFMKECSKHFDVLWIDHHKILEDMNSDKITYLNPGGNNLFCAAYLCYYLFSKIKDLGDYDWLVACACLSDFTIYENTKWMKTVFEKYGDKSEIKPMSLERSPFHSLKRNLEFSIIYFKTKGELRKIFDSIGKGFGNIGDMEKYAKEVEEEVNYFVEKFEKERKEVNGRLVFEFRPEAYIGSLVSNAVSVKHPNKTIFLMRPSDDKHYVVSARRQDGGEDMSNLVKAVLLGLEDCGGGGHAPAAGGFFLKKDKEKVMERLAEL